MDRVEAMRLFVRLAERGSFSGAASDLRIKQSTASKWIAELERSFGASLVARTTRSVRLTDAGRQLHGRAIELLAMFDAVAGELGGADEAPMGRLRLTVPVVFGHRFVTPVLTEFLATHPRVELELSFHDRYVNLVDEGFDAAVRVGVPSDTSARGRKVAAGERLLVASPSYLRERGRVTAPKQLRAHDCLVHGTSSPTAIWRFARSGTHAGRTMHPIDVRGRVSANSSEAALAMARAGLGIALLADWLVREDVASGRLVRLLRTYEAPAAPVYVLTPPHRYPSAAVRTLVDHLASALPKLLARVTSSRDPGSPSRGSASLPNGVARPPRRAASSR